MKSKEKEINSEYIFEKREPKYGKDGNYYKGYIGFTYQDSIISDGIAYFTKYENLCDLKVSHALIVTGKNQCIEAHADGGVQKSTLDKYFAKNKTRISFRKPKVRTPDDYDTVADQIVAAAKKEINAKYGTEQIVVDAIRGTLLGHFLDEISNKKIFDVLSKYIDNEGAFICSELVAFSMKSVTSWKYNNSGILKRPVTAITPQGLFCDKTIFEPWR